MTIWLVSYPRSGNSLVASYLFAHCPDLIAGVGGHMIEIAQWVRGPNARDSRLGPVLDKTHHPAVVKDSDRFVFIVRDGLDATWSHWLWVVAKREAASLPTPSFDEWLEREMYGSAEYPHAHGNVSQWHKFHRAWTPWVDDHKSAVCVRYEDMRAEPSVTARRVAAAFQLHWRDAVPPPFSALHAHDPIHFRKGVVGEGRRELAQHPVRAEMRDALKLWGYPP